MNGDVPSEAGHKDHLVDIDQIVAENKKGDNIIVTSQITIVEVISTLRDPKHEEKFIKLFNGRNVLRHDVDPRVSAKARDIRFHFHNSDEDEKKAIKTPDALHLATAILLGVNEMHTFDDGRKDKNSLLGMSGDSFLGGLKIVKPRVESPELFILGNPAN